MAAAQDKTIKNFGNEATTTTETDPHLTKIDRTAPAGSENSLGAESVRDGRPSTDDAIVQAMDEVTPGVTTPLTPDNRGS